MFGSLTNSEGGLFDDFRRMQRELDQSFGQLSWPTAIRSVARGSFPSINVGATAEQVDVYVFAAGLDPKTIDISIQQNILSIAGERRISAKENAVYYRNERFSGEFRRVISLPDDVDPDKVDARYVNGILNVSIRRQEASQPRRIVIK
jgi:HSP20 family protein